MKLTIYKISLIVIAKLHIDLHYLGNKFSQR